MGLGWTKRRTRPVLFLFLLFLFFWGCSLQLSPWGSSRRVRELSRGGIEILILGRYQLAVLASRGWREEQSGVNGGKMAWRRDNEMDQWTIVVAVEEDEKPCLTVCSLASSWSSWIAVLSQECPADLWLPFLFFFFSLCPEIEWNEICQVRSGKHESWGRRQVKQQQTEAASDRTKTDSMKGMKPASRRRERTIRRWGTKRKKKAIIIKNNIKKKQISTAFPVAEPSKGSFFLFGQPASQSTGVNSEDAESRSTGKGKGEI